MHIHTQIFSCDCFQSELARERAVEYMSVSSNLDLFPRLKSPFHFTRLVLSRFLSVILVSFTSGFVKSGIVSKEVGEL